MVVTRLYAFGSNGCGQLGVGHLHDLSIPQRSCFDLGASELPQDATQNAPLYGESISQIVAGGNHTILLTGSGKVYAAGNNCDGRCGVARSDDNVTQFEVVRSIDADGVTAIAATWEASFVVIARRRVLTFGTGHKGELGLGEGVAASEVPRVAFDVSQAMQESSKIVQISASMSHVIVLLSNGRIYGWGSCRKGQLGEDVKSLKTLWTPRLMKVGFKVSQVVTGRDYSFLAGETGEYALFGDQRYFADKAILPHLAKMRIVSGWSSMIGLAKGQLLGVGRNDKGQLPPDSLSKVIQVAAGSEHVLACTPDGTVLAWGWGEHGNCGIPIDDQGNVVGNPNHIHVASASDEKIAGLAAGCASSFIWTVMEG